MDTTSRQVPFRFYWIAVFLLFPLLWIICRYSGFNGLYGQDSHEYLRYLRALTGFVKGAGDPGPFFWPVMYPFAGMIFSLIMPSILSLQMVSLAAGMLTFLYCNKLLQVIYPAGKERQRYCIFFILLSPFFIRASVVGMSDMLCCYFLTACYYYAFLWKQKENSRDVILACCFGLLAIQTRYAAALMMLPLIPVIFSLFRNRYSILFLVIASGTLALTPTVFFKPQEGFSFLHHPWLETWNPVNIFKSRFVTSEGIFDYTFPNIIYVLAVNLHPGYCFAGIAFLLFSLKPDPAIPRLWIVSIFIYLIFLAGIPFQNLRFLLPVFPFIMIILYPGFEKLWRKIPTLKYRIWIMSAAFVLQMVFTYRAILPMYKYQQEEFVIAEELKQRPPVKLYTFSIDGALRTYQVPQEIINLWNMTDPNPVSGSLVLYNPSRFEMQYTSTPPSRIYNQWRKQGRLAYDKALNNGWHLYKVR